MLEQAVKASLTGKNVRSGGGENSGRFSMMNFQFVPLALAALGLSACTGLTGGVIMGADAAGIYATSPSKPPPPDIADQIPPHESWCYSTMGDTQCFAHAQNVPPERLVNVDPQSSYPVDLAAYRQALLPKIQTVQTVETVTVITPLAAVPSPAVDAMTVAEPVFTTGPVPGPIFGEPPMLQPELSAQPPVKMDPLAVRSLPGANVDAESQNIKEEIREDNAAAKPAILPTALQPATQSP
jgi:hypothetical protein